MLKPRYYFADDFRAFYEYFLSRPIPVGLSERETISGSPDSPMTASNTILLVHLFIFPIMKADAERLSVFMGREQFFPVITRRISILNYP